MFVYCFQGKHRDLAPCMDPRLILHTTLAKRTHPHRLRCHSPLPTCPQHRTSPRCTHLGTRRKKLGRRLLHPQINPRCNINLQPRSDRTGFVGLTLGLCFVNQDLADRPPSVPRCSALHWGAPLLSAAFCDCYVTGQASRCYMFAFDILRQFELF